MVERSVAALKRSLTLPGCGPYGYARRRTREVRVGDVGIGGGNPIRVQSMTTTRALDVEGTVAQTLRLVEAGCELVRVAVPTVEDAACLREIRARLNSLGVRVPLIADIHFSSRAALEAARWVEKVRINPGNYADARTFARREYSEDEYARELERIEGRLLPLIRHCKEYGVAMRIGTNHGSLSDRIVSRFGDTPEGMVESALEFVRICERHGYRDLVVSMKASNPKVMIQAYRLLAARMSAERMDYPFHLGVTEAGSGQEARVKSAAGIGTLLDDGIGDTIRVSLAEEPEAEIPVARWLADLYSGPSAAVRLASVQEAPRGAPPEVRDPFTYRRRVSRAISIGRVTVGGGVPLVVAEAGLACSDASLLERLFATGAGPRTWPDLLEVSVAGLEVPAARRRLSALRAALAARSQSAPIVAVAPAEHAGGLASGVADLADCLKLTAAPEDGADVVPRNAEAGVRAAAATLTRGLPLWLEADDTPSASGRPAWDRVVDCLMALVGEAKAAGQDALVLGLRFADPSRAIRAGRLLAARLSVRGHDYPLALSIASDAAAALRSETPRLPTAPIALGSLLADGIGDVVHVQAQPTALDEADGVRLAFYFQQALGARTSKSEIEASPSCGRTVFDLQSTVERIKARTSHLVGVKIAVMGCVVNGPGELADADFGYMGGAPGRVSLYVGRECVEKNVPADEADERLTALIKARGRWVDPPD